MIKSHLSKVLAAATILASGVGVQHAASEDETVSIPRLVTFGTRAQQSEGDHDYRQFVRISVPKASGDIHFRILDPDVGGEYDEALRGFNTRTRFSLYGDGASIERSRDVEGVIQENINGSALGSEDYGYNEHLDGQWVTVFSSSTEQGAEDGGNRVFYLAVEGLNGDDGNVFDLMVSRSGTENQPIDGVELTSYVPTLQVAEDEELAELRFDIPDGAEALMVENFDAAGGTVSYAGRFFSAPLTPSSKSQWQTDKITLRDGEAGRAASIKTSGGDESPNDVTIVVSVPSKDGSEPAEIVPIRLPIKTVAANQRPYVLFNNRQNSCAEMTFDASETFDGDGDALSFNWYFDESDEPVSGARIVQSFETRGNHRGRLEVLDASGVVANGRAIDFDFHIKPPPVAVFEAPPLVAQGADMQVDGTASSTMDWPEGNRITRYHWKMGDGGEIIQNEGDADFGRPTYQYANYGTYKIDLTVTDTQGIACNVASASRTIVVNAPPVADAGGDRVLLTGEVGEFNGSASRDPDGSIASYWWDFGNGKRVFGPSTPHAFHRPGTYPVRLTVIDDTVYETAAHTDVITVTVRDDENTRPLAKGGEDLTVAMGEVVTFDGSGSEDADGRILFYLWDFGDGSGDEEPIAKNTYWVPGTYPVNLTVRDEIGGDGGQSVDAVTVTVVPAENRPPVLDFPSDFVTTLHVPVQFDASGASDRDGSVVTYEWDFGDGATGTGAKIEHRYDEVGNYNGKLVLTDDGLPTPKQTAIEFSVLVTNKANSAPAPEITASDTGLSGEKIWFDASATSDTDGAIRSYAWDFGDGHRAAGIQTHHVYQFPGQYRITLTVTDNDVSAQRLTAKHVHDITINRPDNAVPTASAGANRTVGLGEILRFDGTASSDPDGNILAYAWRFGDGGVSADAKPLHAFHDVGTYTVELTVTDDGIPARDATTSFVVQVVDEGEGRASK